MVLCRKGDSQWHELTRHEAREVRDYAKHLPIGWQYCHRPQWDRRYSTVFEQNYRPTVFDQNSRARTHGLSRVEYDGKEGRVLGWDARSARFIVKLEGSTEPVRIKSRNLLCRMMSEAPEDEVDSEEEDEPSWCLATREVFVRWIPARASSGDPTASLQMRAAEALLAAGTSTSDLRGADVPDNVVDIVERATRGGLLICTVPHRTDLWADDGYCNIGCLMAEFELPHVDGARWRFEQSRTHGARWVLPVMTTDDH